MKGKRNLLNSIDLLALKKSKMAFISGPRQVGKTTLAKMFLSRGKHGRYCNWDELDFRRIWTKSPKNVLEGLKTGSILILDEIHKATKWKQNLKGLYDTLEKKIKIIVTGSVKLNIYRRSSDSLMGRTFGFRLHPFSIGELHSRKIISPSSFMKLLQGGLPLSRSRTIQNLWKKLYLRGGFPEPFLSSSAKLSAIWQKERIEKIVREDLRDLTSIPNLGKIEMLVSLLPERVGSSLSLTSLGEECEASYDTVKRWMRHLQELYYHFEIGPWHKRVARSLKKESKLYLWDWSEVKDPSARFENMVASHLLKACHYWTDTGEGRFNLYYLKTKDKKEVDFLITRDNVPWLPVECKLNRTTASPNFAHFAKQFDLPVFVQLIDKPNYLERESLGKKAVWICSAGQFFRHLP